MTEPCYEDKGDEERGRGSIANLKLDLILLLCQKVLIQTTIVSVTRYNERTRYLNKNYKTMK